NLEIQLPGMWDGIELSPVLKIKDRADRRFHHRQIIIETLRAIDPRAPTKGNLQRLCHIRKKTFLPLLKYLIGCGAIVKVGAGTKGSPFRYRLAEKYGKGSS